MANVRNEKDYLGEADRIIADLGLSNVEAVDSPENHRVTVARARQIRRSTFLILSSVFALNVIFLGWVAFFERAGFSAIDPMGGTSRLMVKKQ